MEFDNKVDLARFGSKPVRDLVREGLAEIPALKWQYLVTSHSVLGPGTDWFEVEGSQLIDISTAKALHEQGAVFIDTSEIQMWNEGHIPGAIHLPYDRTGDPNQKRYRRTTLREVADYDDVIVLHFVFPEEDAIASASWESAKALAWGYRNVYRFVGGVRAWKEAGYPVETAQ